MPKNVLVKINPTTLTDGSKVYSVCVFSELTGAAVHIDCLTERDARDMANKFHDAIEEHATG